MLYKLGTQKNLATDIKPIWGILEKWQPPRSAFSKLWIAFFLRNYIYNIYDLYIYTYIYGVYVYIYIHVCFPIVYITSKATCNPTASNSMQFLPSEPLVPAGLDFITQPPPKSAWCTRVKAQRVMVPGKLFRQTFCELETRNVYNSIPLIP